MTIKTLFGQFLLLGGVCLWAGCLIPTTTNLQSARVADKGKLRFTPYYASIDETGEDGDKLADEVGALAGVGVGHGVEIQLRYDRINISGENDGYNFTSLGPKFSGLNNRLAFVLPIGTYYGGEISSLETIQIHPGLIGTVPISQVGEISTAVRFLFAPNGDVDDWFVLTGGFGLSSDVSQWAVMPEVGMAWNQSQDDVDPLLSFGVALVVYSQ